MFSDTLKPKFPLRIIYCWCYWKR